MNSAMKVTSVQSDWVGRVIDGRFTLLQWLGRSDHSGVFLTELTGTPSQKAVIRLLPHDVSVGTRVAFSIGASRTHANLERVLESGRCEIDDTQFIFVVTEFADEVLSEILPVRPLTPDEMKEMLVPVLDILSGLHEHGLVHGRLKPSNIFVINDRLKLSSDSIQLASGTAGMTAALSIYDAPERAAGTVSPASDMWSLGVTIVEALTQKTPDWSPAVSIDPHIPNSIPQPFAGIAAACVQVNPSHRATVNDVRSRLGIAVPPSVPRAMHKRDSTTEPESSGKPWLASLFVVGLLLVGMAAFILWHPSLQQSILKPSDKSSVQPSAPEPPAAAPQQPPLQQATPEPEQQPPPPAAAPPSTVTPRQSGVGAIKGAASQRVMPEILPSASDSIRGTVNVRVRLNVSPAGDVTDAAFESAGPSKYFARVAMDAARQWKFRPAQANGQPVASVWTLQFLFSRGNTDVIPEQTEP